MKKHESDGPTIMDGHQKNYRMRIPSPRVIPVTAAAENVRSPLLNGESSPLPEDEDDEDEYVDVEDEGLSDTGNPSSPPPTTLASSEPAPTPSNGDKPETQPTTTEKS